MNKNSLNPNDGSGERKEVPLDEEAICTATYEPNNDLDKDFGEESGSSDDYIEQVKKSLVMKVDLKTKNLNGYLSATQQRV